MTSDNNATTTHEAEISNEARDSMVVTDKFLKYMGSDWQTLESAPVSESEGAAFAAQRRAALSKLFPGKRIVVPAGALKQRANDTFYLFRPDTGFTHLTGWGAKTVPGSVLVLEPKGETHEAHLFFPAPAGRDSEEFFNNHEVGEFWVGARPSLDNIATILGIPTHPIEEFQADDADLTLQDADLATALSELRFVKDSYEIKQMQLAVDATQRGFNEVVAALPEAIAEKRGERVVEGVFHKRARLDGNWEGYNTIAAAGANACTLHWEDNDGVVKPGDLLLLDAGVEVDSLYTADITRTLPISGSFSDVQRKVYEAVLEAADAAIAVIKPGIIFADVHEAALAVIEKKIKEWGIWPADADPDIAYHKRYMVHGTSHHLGIDVHDCAAAKRELYIGGEVKEGMVFTVEPGLYFHPGDKTVPEEFWGIGVRIEDDIVVTADGCVNLSADIPRTVDAVEEWIKKGRNQ